MTKLNLTFKIPTTNHSCKWGALRALVWTIWLLPFGKLWLYQKFESSFNYKSRGIGIRSRRALSGTNLASITDHNFCIQSFLFRSGLAFNFTYRCTCPVPIGSKFCSTDRWLQPRHKVFHHPPGNLRRGHTCICKAQYITFAHSTFAHKDIWQKYYRQVSYRQISISSNVFIGKCIYGQMYYG